MGTPLVFQRDDDKYTVFMAYKKKLPPISQQFQELDENTSVGRYSIIECSASHD